MKTQRNNDVMHVSLKGPIGESTGLFLLPLKDLKELVIDMTEVTFINSIGVKHWISWTLKFPRVLKVKLFNCPFVIASQASIVVGFMTPAMSIESFRMPYACPDCGREEMLTATRGQEYEYPRDGQAKKIALPEELPCPKCGKGPLEPDFFLEKTFKFLG